MAREPRPGGKPSGPARTPRRPRPTGSGRTPTLTLPPAVAPVAASLGRAARRLPRGGNLMVTRRLLVFGAVLVVMALSFAGSLRVYVVQSGELALARQQIADRTARVAELESSLQRWKDPAYVRAQARDRLGWVMPGEVGYRVIGRDGRVISGDQELTGVGAPRSSGLETRWWDRLAGTIAAADAPEPLQR